MPERRIYIVGGIGTEVTLMSVLEQLDGVSASDDLEVLIHSNGGSVHEGWAIHNALLDTKAKITTVAAGMVGSIATIPFLAGSTRIMQAGTQFFIHNPWGGRTGDAEALRAYSNELEAAETEMLDYYTSRTGADRQRIQNYMKEETGLTASEALNLGFATELREPVYALAKIGQRPQSKTANMEKKTIVAAFKEVMQEVIGSSPKALTLSLATGEQISVQTSENVAAVGDAVKMADGSKSLSDGSHVLSDKRTFAIEGGKISAIEEAPEVLPTEVINAFKEGIETMKASFDKQMAVATEQAAAQAEQIKALTSQLEGFKRDTAADKGTVPKAHEVAENPAKADKVARSKARSEAERKKFAEIKAKALQS